VAEGGSAGPQAAAGQRYPTGNTDTQERYPTGNTRYPAGNNHPICYPAGNTVRVSDLWVVSRTRGADVQQPG